MSSRTASRALARGSSQDAAPIAPDIVEIDAALRRLGRAAIQRRLHERAAASAGVDLDRAGASLLSALVREDEAIRLSDLADRLGVEAPTVSRKVHQLEAAGLVERAPDPDDGRACRLTATAAGYEASERLQATHCARLAEVVAHWSPEDRTQLARLLHQLAGDFLSERGASQ